MKAGTHHDKVGKESPTGDLSKRDDSKYRSFFKRLIKSPGVSEHASDYLKVRPFAKEGGGNLP